MKHLLRAVVVLALFLLLGCTRYTLTCADAWRGLDRAEIHGTPTAVYVAVIERDSCYREDMYP